MFRFHVHGNSYISWVSQTGEVTSIKRRGASFATNGLVASRVVFCLPLVPLGWGTHSIHVWYISLHLP